MTTKRYGLLALTVLCTTATLQAQHGCTHSPEAPTDVLMLVGSIGMFYGSSVVTKVLRRGKE